MVKRVLSLLTNFWASLPVLAVFVIGSAFSSNKPLDTPTLYSDINVTAVLGFDPRLRTALPPVYFCGESVPVHEEVVARRLVSALSTEYRPKSGPAAYSASGGCLFSDY